MIMGYRGGPLFRRSAVLARAQGFVRLAAEGAQSSVLSARAQGFQTARLGYRQRNVLSARAQGFTTGRTENHEGKRSRATAAVLRPRNDWRLGGQDHADPAGTNRTNLTIAGPDRFLLNAPWRCSTGNCAVGNGSGPDGRAKPPGQQNKPMNLAVISCHLRHVRACPHGRRDKPCARQGFLRCHGLARPATICGFAARKVVDGRTMTFGRSLLIFSNTVTWTTIRAYSAVPFLLSPWPSAVLRGTAFLACRHSHPPVLAGMAQTSRHAS